MLDPVYALRGEGVNSPKSWLAVAVGGEITWVATFKVIISILQSYFTHKYLGICVHMKAIDLLFQMSYGSLIYSKRLHSDRPKC